MTVGDLIEILQNYPSDLVVRDFSLDLRDPKVQEIHDPVPSPQPELDPGS